MCSKFTDSYYELNIDLKKRTSGDSLHISEYHTREITINHDMCGSITFFHSNSEWLFNCICHESYKPCNSFSRHASKCNSVHFQIYDAYVQGAMVETESDKITPKSLGCKTGA